MTRIGEFFLLLGCLQVFSGAVHADGMARYGLQDVCGRSIMLSSPLSGTSSSGILVPKKFGSYLENNDCTVTITASNPFNYGITVSVRTMDLRPYSADTLTIRYKDGFDKTQVFQNAFPYQNREHDNFESKSYHSTTFATINFRTLTGGYRTFSFDGFELIITATSQAPCSSYEFRCHRFPAYCISNDLRCDGHNHCADRSDQSNCDDEDEEVEESQRGVIIGCVVGGVVVVAVIGSCIAYWRWGHKCRTKGGVTRTMTAGTQPAYIPPPPSAPPPAYGEDSAAPYKQKI